MTVTCNLNESDYRALRRYAMFRYRKIHWIYGAMIIGLLLLTWSGEKPDATTTQKVCDLIGVVVFFLLFALIFLLILKIIARFTRSRFSGTIGNHTFEIGDDFLIETNPNGKIETRLSGICQVAETKKYFFVITTTGSGHVIPKKDLQNFDALHSLQAKVKR